MFSRILNMTLKPNHEAELTKIVEGEIIPLLKQQVGFKDEIFFVTSDGTEAFGISLWDRKESADSYSEKGYPKVLQALTSVLNGTPRIKTCNVISSTFHQVTVKTTV